MMPSSSAAAAAATRSSIGGGGRGGGHGHGHGHSHATHANATTTTLGSLCGDDHGGHHRRRTSDDDDDDDADVTSVGPQSSSSPRAVLVVHGIGHGRNDAFDSDSDSVGGGGVLCTDRCDAHHTTTTSTHSLPPTTSTRTSASDIEAAQTSRRLTIATILCISFFLIELLAGLYSRSLAILSDSFHLLSDVAGFGISLAALHLARMPATNSHSFGFARVEILGAMLSTFLIWALTFYLVLEAFARIRNPEPIDAVVMCITAVIGVIINLVLAFTLHSPFSHSHSHAHGGGHGGHGGDHVDEGSSLLQQQRQREMNINLRSAAIHVIGDLISSLGVLIASLIILVFPSYTIVDPICTFIFSGIVIATTVSLMHRSVDVLMEATPREVDTAMIRNALLDVEGVIDVHDLHVWTLSQGQINLTAHVVVVMDKNGGGGGGEGGGGSARRALRRALRAVRAFGIEHATIQVEPL